MFALDRVIDKRRETVATAQILFGRRSVGGCLSRQLDFLIRTKLEPQTFDDPLHDRVLHADDVAGVRIDTLAPENLAGTNVEQLRSHTQPITGAKKSRRQDRINRELASRFSRIDGLILILNDD